MILWISTNNLLLGTILMATRYCLYVEIIYDDQQTPSMLCQSNTKLGEVVIPFGNMKSSWCCMLHPQQRHCRLQLPDLAGHWPSTQ